MAVEWTERLSVGYADIDEQHRELFRRFNDLLEACRERRGKEKIFSLFVFLDDYVGTHFRAEERLMDRHGYPRAEEHKRQHRHFVQELTAMKEALQSRGTSLDLVVQTNQALLDWIVSHIKNIDVQFGTFLKTVPLNGALYRK